MRLNITHRTIYSYEDAPTFYVQVLRLTPRTNPSQHVTRWRIDTPGGLSAWSDAFGNLCHTLVVDEPVTRMEIVARGEVITRDTSGVLPREDGELPLEVFLRQTDKTRPDAAMESFLRGFESAAAKDRLDALHRMTGEIAERVPYETGGTHVHSTAAEAFADGVGVCQDHAHIFIGCARALGIPARYVSGYLHDGHSDGPHVASHAWAAAWVDDLGWVSFDISNGKSGTEGHVGVAIGLDYASASPIRGVRVGDGEDEALEVAVSVGAMQQ